MRFEVKSLQDLEHFCDNKRVKLTYLGLPQRAALFIRFHKGSQTFTLSGTQHNIVLSKEEFRQSRLGEMIDANKLEVIL